MQTPPTPQIHLNSNRRTNHPWISDRDVVKPAQKVRGGTVVDIIERSGQWVGRGFYNGHARIAVRVLTTRRDENIDDAFFAGRLARAMELRQKLGIESVTNAYRLVHSEGDGLSGLVIDRFGDQLVVEYFAAGMYRFRPVIERLLLERFPSARIYFFMEQHLQKQESIDVRSPEPPVGPITIHEHGLSFLVAPGSKQKTGFFVDQRDNRRALAELTRNGRVLDLCCSTGGFAIYARTLGGAAAVTGIDLDESAMEVAQRNAELNQAQVSWQRADIYTWLRAAAAAGERYDVVVLDPARQTRDPRELDAALGRYLDMNKLAMAVTAPGGLLLSCSCSGLVREEDFLEAIRRAGTSVGREAQIFRLSGAAPDHPFLAHALESRYLKAAWIRVN
ncbi:MAG: class I SAM-dependent rRNA methyltransferase [Planctomycetota bacterium]